MNVQLFGSDAETLRPVLEKYPDLAIVDCDPDVIVCYGGDGTLLTAERRWACVPKVPIRNSRRGHRMIAHPPEDVIERLAAGRLVETEFIKLRCVVHNGSGAEDPARCAMNEFNVMLGRTNAAIRYKILLDEEPFENGVEIIGDGFVVSTPFGSTAYYRQITRGIFYCGLGLAFKYTSVLSNHVVVPETTVITAEITRGPAVLAHDNSSEFRALDEGDTLVISQDPHSATVLTWEPLKRPSDEF